MKITPPNFSLGILIAGLFGLSVGISEEKQENTFKWPLPGSIGVTERVLKNGKRTTLEYVVKVTACADHSLIVKLVDFKVSSVDGEKVTQELETALKPVVASFNALPSFRISPQGHLIGIEGLDKAIDATAELANKLRGDNSGQEWVKGLRTDKGTAALKQILAEYWSVWVEMWIGFPASTKEPIVENIEQALFPGTVPLRTERTFTNHGIIDEAAHTSRLTLESYIEDKRLGKCIGEFLRGFDEIYNKTRDRTPEKLPGIACYSLCEVKIDLSTMRPRWAKKGKIAKIIGSDESKDQTIFKEIREYTFHWPAGF